VLHKRLESDAQVGLSETIAGPDMIHRDPLCSLFTVDRSATMKNEQYTLHLEHFALMVSGVYFK